MARNYLPRGPSKKSNLSEAEEYWRKNFSGRLSDELADMFDVLYSSGKFVGGGIGGVDRQKSGGVINEYHELAGLMSPFGNEMLGPDNPLEMTNGREVNFRREVDPYMMYKYPNTPEMWDEMRWDPKMGRGFKNGFEISDRAREMEREDAREDMWDMGMKRDMFGNRREGLLEILRRQQESRDRLARMRRGR